MYGQNIERLRMMKGSLITSQFDRDSVKKFPSGQNVIILACVFHPLLPRPSASFGEYSEGNWHGFSKVIATTGPDSRHM